MGRTRYEDGSPDPYPAQDRRLIIGCRRLVYAKTMPVLEQITELLSLPETGAGAPTLARVEDTLTEGYAEALALEAERLRLERRLGSLAREASGGDASTVAERFVTISERITDADGELTRLRALLSRLNERARSLRRRS
jgi:hypothetical protein